MMNAYEQGRENSISFDQIAEGDRIRVIYTNPHSGYDVVGTVSKVINGVQKVVRVDLDPEYHDSVGVYISISRPDHRTQFYILPN